MKEPYGEGLASHTDPESCAGSREGAGEALTGAHTGQPLSCEINPSRVPTVFTQPEGNIEHGAKRESCENPAQSKTLSMCGNSRHGNREIPVAPVHDGWTGRSEKANSRTSGVYATGKSDGCIIPEKPPNKGCSPVEVVEERQPTERNILESAMPRTQSGAGVSIGLQGVREAAIAFTPYTRGRSRMR